MLAPYSFFVKKATNYVAQSLEDFCVHSIYIKNGRPQFLLCP